MDYKYIEQLLDRYWACETTQAEEQILRSFFQQEDVPAHLAQYAPLFVYQSEARDAQLSAGFDKRMEALIEAEDEKAGTTRARVVPFSTRMAPFLKAAAVVAVILTMGGAAERALITAPSGPTDTAAPAVANTYVRSDKVAEAVAPVSRRVDATANAQSTDSLVHAKSQDSASQADAE